MGMDVFGKKPDSEVGEYFRNNVWWWRPLAEYVCEVAPDITQACVYWHSNDGDGLNKKDSIALAKVLRQELNSGNTARYAEQFESDRSGLSNDNFNKNYPFSVENVQEFTEFLEHCGGFEIC